MARSVVLAFLLTLSSAAPAHAQLAAAVLPSARSVQVGQSVTAFATIINTSETLATGCRIEPSRPFAGEFRFQTTDPLTNAVTGTRDMPVDIPPGGAQTFVIGLTPTVTFRTTIHFRFTCANMVDAPVISGVNTL